MSSARQFLLALAIFAAIPLTCLIWEQVVLNIHIRAKVQDLQGLGRFAQDHVRELLAAREEMPDDTWRQVGKFPAPATGKVGSCVYLVKYAGLGTRFVDAPEDCTSVVERIETCLRE